ncbi:hypothetical protein [Cohnella lubricantis]|uniref:Lipoprotein n=1 Tax=Cohnella lubricantis TaxID=2163172 RepID=A0A841TKL6_9BACL|nr:hypothetical protein [Cohnella lubricantis]MBB6679730.1 hypothetical protein [Cohnella lubricantis]MBP2120539.1 hypothetical protein [Cohnella lubricantis]
MQRKYFKTIVSIQLIFLILVGCSKSKQENLMDQIKTLNAENSVIDTIISKVDPGLQDGVILSSFRNPDQRRPSIYKLISHIDSFKGFQGKPLIPEYYYYLAIRGQKIKSLQTYEINLIVDPSYKYLKLISIGSGDNNQIIINKEFEITSEMKSELTEIITK